MANKMWKLYVHTNKLNGKKYVGITSKENINHRWRNGDGYKENPHFRSAIEEYGWDNFEHEILFDDLSESEAKLMERFCIIFWRTKDRNFGYNMTYGGDGTKGYFPSEETRNKLSIARRKENLSEETLRRRSAGLKGRRFSDEHKRKIGEGNSKPIIMLDKSNNILESFSSAHEAELKYGISHSHISQCCSGKRQTTGGYKWQFA